MSISEIFQNSETFQDSKFVERFAPVDQVSAHVIETGGLVQHEHRVVEMVRLQPVNGWLSGNRGNSYLAIVDDSSGLVVGDSIQAKIAGLYVHDEAGPDEYTLPILADLKLIPSPRLKENLINGLRTVSDILKRERPDNFDGPTIDGNCELVSSRPLSRGYSVKEAVQAAFRC